MFQPLEAVNRGKQRQLTRLALAYLKRNGQLNAAARFDVIGVCLSDEGPKITHIVNAFEPVGEGQMFS